MHLAFNKTWWVEPSHMLFTYKGRGSCVQWLAGQWLNSCTEKNKVKFKGQRINFLEAAAKVAKHYLLKAKQHGRGPINKPSPIANTDWRPISLSPSGTTNLCTSKFHPIGDEKWNNYFIFTAGYVVLGLQSLSKLQKQIYH